MCAGYQASDQGQLRRRPQISADARDHRRRGRVYHRDTTMAAAFAAGWCVPTGGGATDGFLSLRMDDEPARRPRTSNGEKEWQFVPAGRAVRRHSSHKQGNAMRKGRPQRAALAPGGWNAPSRRATSQVSAAASRPRWRCRRCRTPRRYDEHRYRRARPPDGALRAQLTKGAFSCLAGTITAVPPKRPSPSAGPHRMSAFPGWRRNL
jgi:hypothetical protein